GGRTGAESCRGMVQRICDHVRTPGICTFSRKGSGRGRRSALNKRNRDIEPGLSKSKQQQLAREPRHGTQIAQGVPVDRRIVLIATLAAAAASGASVYSAWAEPGVLRIAAAADMRFAMDEIIGAFRRKYPTVRVEVTYGSSGNFYAQLSNHAPFDIFFSADVDYPRRLIREGAALADTEFVYGIGRL